MLACVGDDPKHSDTAGTCEVIEDRSCGHGTPEGEDSACPEGYRCWGPSAYGGGTTYDLLPGGETGAYWADGVLLGSTLR